MRYFIAIFLSFFIVGCGATTDNTETPQAASYYLTYDDTSTTISGDATFDVGVVTPNHIVTLTNFTATVDSCNITNFTGIVAPDPLTFTSSTTKQIATINVTLSAPCTTQTLQIKATYKDTSLLDGKLIERTKDMTYNYTLTQTTTTSNYTPVLKKSDLNITTNKQTESVVVAVYDDQNRPATDGTVSIIYPDAAKSNDVGSFSQTTVTVAQGEALFSYTAPNDLQTLIANGINSTSFKFYYNDAITKFAELAVSFTPETNQTIIKNYAILFKPQDDSYKMSLEESKSFSISIIDDDNVALASGDVLELNVSLENSLMAQLIDSNGTKNSSFSFNNINNTTLTLESKTISGLVPIHVNSKFKDINGDTQYLNRTFNIIVESGPPTSISISYAGTDQNVTSSKFIEHFAISVTDKYFNPVNTNPQVSVGAIVGYALYDDNTTHRIYVPNITTQTENIRSSLYNDANNSTVLEINSTLIDTSLTNIDIYNDTLVTFGDGYTYPASGGWNIDQNKAFDANHIYLSSGQYFNEKNTSNLGFAIGRNHRQDTCIFGDEWVGQVKLQNSASTIDDAGTAIIELSYDYYLVGKDIVLYINIIGKDNKLDKELRIGEATKHTLRGHGLEIGSVTSVTAESNSTETLRIYSWMKDTGGAPYRNARFGFQDIALTGDCDVVSGSSSTLITSRPDVTKCANDSGHSYVDLTIKAKAGDSTSCSLTVDKPVIINEF